MIRLVRHAHNPILRPTERTWENLRVFNPAATVVGRTVHMLYRAQGYDGISRLGHASSTDGISFARSENWVYEGGGHEYETLGVEDPRLVEIDGLYFLVYTAVSEIAGSVRNAEWREQVDKRIRVSAATTVDFRTFNDLDVILPDVDAKDAALFPGKHQGQYWLLYRDEKTQTHFTHTSDLISCCRDWHFVFSHRPGFWDSVRTGIGSPPLETEDGWLIFYHGVDESNTYRLGVMLLDKAKPDRVLWRSPEPILEPVEEYEKSGFIPNVVFTCGAVEYGDEYFVYYGAADQTICLATVDKEALLSEIRDTL